LRRLQQEVAASFEKELADSSVNVQRLHNLLRTASGTSQPTTGPWDIMQLINRTMKARMGITCFDDAPVDTPHRRMAGDIHDIQELINSTQGLPLSAEHTLFIQLTETARSNILSVTSVVADFIVRCGTL
jgi:hypothetical protein